MSLPTNVIYNPIFPVEADDQWSGIMVTAGAGYTVASGTRYAIYTAPANGSLVYRIDLLPVGDNVASLVRFWMNNGSDVTVVGNSGFLGEVALPAWTSSTTAIAPKRSFSFNKRMKPGYILYATLGVTVASGWRATVLADRY